MKNKDITILSIFIIVILILVRGTSLLYQTPITNENDLKDIEIIDASEKRIEKSTRSATDWPMHLGSLSHLGFTSSSVPSDNSIIWSNTTGSGDGYGSPVVADGKVFVGSADGYIYCFDLNSGTRLWRTYLSSGDFGVCGTPAVVNDHVIVFSSGDDILYRLRVSDGGIDWISSSFSGAYGGSSPAINNGRIYIGSGNRNLYCLDETNGNLIWSYTTEYGPVRNYGIQSSPAFANGRVFIGSCDGYLYCFNESQPSAPSAEYYWRTNLFDAIFGSPAVTNQRVYCGSGYYNYGEGTGSHKLFCLDELTGAVIWSFQTGSDIMSSPAIAYGNAYFTSTDGELYCVDATSSGPSPKLHWSETIGDTWSSPAVSDGKVVVGSRGTNTVYCFNATTGSLVWSYNVGNDVYSSPAIADGKVIVSVRGFPESIYCFGGGQPPLPPPNPPTNLQAQLAGGGLDLQLSWDASFDDGTGEDDVMGYTVYKSSTGVNGVYEFAGWILADDFSSYNWIDSGAGDGNPNDYFYIVRANDTLDIEEQNSDKVGKVVYDLVAGWNLISIPLEQSNTARENVFLTLGTNYAAVQGYHAGKSTPWLHWHRDKPNQFNDVIDINHKEGYYIYMDSADSLVVAGRVLETTQISLKAGWNLVGYPSLETKLRDTALASILGSFNKVEFLDAASGVHEAVGSSDPMTPGYGYWIHTTVNCDWDI